MKKEMYNNLINLYKEADMVVLGLGNQLSYDSFSDDNKRIELLERYNKILDKKNYFIVTSHKKNIFDGTSFNERRISNPLIQDENSEKQWDLYNKWLSATLNKKLLIIEIGEDFNTPNIFRWPFEKVIFINQKSKMFRINNVFYQLPAEIDAKDRAMSIQADGMSFISELIDYIV